MIRSALTRRPNRLCRGREVLINVGDDRELPASKLSAGLAVLISAIVGLSVLELGATPLLVLSVVTVVLGVVTIKHLQRDLRYRLGSDGPPPELASGADHRLSVAALSERARVLLNNFGIASRSE